MRATCFPPSHQFPTRHFFSILFLCGLICNAAALDTSPALSLQPYQASYAATFNGMPIEAQRTLIKSEQAYRLEIVAKNLLGSMREVEQLHLDTEGRIRIDGYRAERSFFGSKRKEKLIIDALGNKATYTRKKKNREINLLPEYLGPLGYQLQLRRDLTQPSTNLSYTVMVRGKIKHYQFERLGEELVSTELGHINALKIRRVRENKDRETIFWMAKSLAYLPIKIWQREDDGETYEMTLKSVTIDEQE